MKFRFTIARFLLITFLLLIPVFFSCTKSGTDPPPAPELKLSLAEEPRLTDIRLKLEMKNVEFPQTFTLVRDGLPIAVDTANTNATTITDTALSPSTTYRYRAYRLQNGAREDSSALFETRTMDTTSHNFQWELIEFPSPYGSGELRDVAIIDDNNIWAVGEIYSDSAQPWLAYNAVNWDGHQWELKRIPYMYNGQPIYHPINFTFSFENGEIWFGGNGIVKWNDQKFSNVEVPQSAWGPVAINKAWGSSSDNVYIVGNEGHISHYDGQGWQRIESGTDLPIQDIWGASDLKTGKIIILCPASKKYQISDKKILRINPETNQISFVEWPFQDRRVHSVWFKNGRQTWICGAGVFMKQNDIWNEFRELPLIFTNRIRGNDVNDIFVAGDFGFVAHYNGLTWKIYPEVNTPLYESLDMKNNMMIAVGQLNQKGIVAIGRR